MRLSILIVILFASTVPALADSWSPPCAKEYYSSDSSYFVVITPTSFPEKYYNWLGASAKKRNRYSARDTTVVHCQAKMYKWTYTGYSLIWEQKLINKIAPVSAMVSDNGKFLVTFDNWYSVGYGVDVMVVYNDKGKLLKRHMLEDISPFPINTYTFSISSLWWRCSQTFIDNSSIEICFLKEDNEKAIKIYDLKELKIVGVTGSPK